jgi:sugar lactone lactonase YvrE
MSFAVPANRRLSAPVATLAAVVLALTSLIAASSAPNDTTADRVFGQGGSFTSDFCNPGGTSAASLCFPTGVAADASGNVFVADFQNNRVLQFNTPLASDTIADRVLGQGGSFSGGGCNTGGVGSGLCGPVDAAVDGAGNVYVADRNNNRVLEYNAPLSTDTVPDRVFGQAGNFSTSTCNLGGTSAGSLCSPGAVHSDSAGNVYIVDGNNHRVLIYQNPLSTDTIADRVLGQSDSFSSSACNAAGLSNPPTAATLCLPSGVAVDGSGNVYVADASNNRVVQYDVPLLTDSVADRVFGQGGSFTSDGCNASLCAPQAVALDANGDLYIVDAHSRVLVYDSPLTDQAADRVFGQPDLNSFGCNQGGTPNADTLCYSHDATVDASGNLYIADQSNNRVLEYDATAAATPTGTASSTATPVPVGGVAGLAVGGARPAAETAETAGFPIEAIPLAAGATGLVLGASIWIARRPQVR